MMHFANLDNGETSANILWICGDEDIMEFVYREHGFGYWTACFDVLMEKHGFLSFDRASPDALLDEEKLKKYDFLIVSWIPEAFWKKEYLKGIKSFEGGVFLEGPLPDEVAEYLGLGRSEGTGMQGPVNIMGRCLRDYMNKFFTEIIQGQGKPLVIAPKRVTTKSTDIARQELRLAADHELADRLHDIVLSYLIAYKWRFEKNGQFFPDGLTNALTYLTWMMFLQKLEEGLQKKKYVELCNTYLAKLMAPGIITASDDVEAVAVYGCVFALAYKHYGVQEYREKGVDIFRRLLVQLEARKATWKDAWLLLLAALLGKDTLDKTEQKAIGTVVANIEAQRVKHWKGLPARGVFVLKLAQEYLAESDVELFGQIQRLLEKHPAVRKQWIDGGQGGEVYSGQQVLDALFVAYLVDNPRVRTLLLQACLECCFDAEKGFFRNGKLGETQQHGSGGYLNSPWVPLGIMQVVPAIKIRDFSAVLRNYTRAQIAAWQAAPYWIDLREACGCEVMASVEIGRKEWPWLFRKGNVIASSFQLLSYLVHFHTLHPLEEAFYDCVTRHAMFFEHALFHLIVKQAQALRAPLVKMHPWPWGYEYCMTIRHDVDRIPDVEQFQRLLAFEKEHKLGVSWYWIPGRTCAEYMRQIEKVGHEQGLHAMQLINKDREKRMIEQLLTVQKSVVGECWHGGGGGDYWIGHPSIRSAIEAGMKYTEFVSTIYDFPYAAFPAIDETGRVKKERAIGITHTASIDHAVRKASIIGKAAWIKELAKFGAYCMVLNHPDVNFEGLREWVNVVPAKGRLNWNAAEVADWWERTHIREKLSIRKIRSEQGAVCLCLWSELGVKDLEIHLPMEEVKDVSAYIDGQPVEIEWSPGRRLNVNVTRIRVDVPPDKRLILNVVL